MVLNINPQEVHNEQQSLSNENQSDPHKMVKMMEKSIFSIANLKEIFKICSEAGWV